MKEGYLRNKVHEITGVPPATIQQYTDKGLITPSVANPTGRGTNRRYSARDMVEILLCREMVNAGVSHRDIKEIMEFLWTRRPKDKPDRLLDPELISGKNTSFFIVKDPGLDSLQLSFNGHSIKLVKKPRKIVVDMEGFRRSFIFDLKRIVDKVKTGI